MNLSEAWENYYTDKQLEGYSSTTLKGYKVQYNLLLKYFGDINIDDITLLSLKTYLLEKGSHLKPSSLGMRIRCIRAFFRWANEEGYCSTNPSRKLKEPKLGKPIPKALNEEDIEMFRESCKSIMEHALIEFLYTSGCRIGEVYRLNITDINWDNHSCIVLGKGNKEREVYFNLRCALWLKRYLKQRKDNDPALFVTERAPHRISIDMIRYIVKRVAKNSELQINIYPHKLRHSYATHLLNNGASLEGIQTLMGHAKIETTMIYTNLAGPRRKEIYVKYF